MKAGLRVALLFFAALAILLVPRGTLSHDPITTKIRFNKEIVRIFQRHCLACHTSESSTNILLDTYERARPWAKSFKEEVLEKRMPPFQAVKGFGRFHDDYALTQLEIDQIVSWVEGGVPKGDEKDLPAQATSANKWTLGQPDLVLSNDSSEVPSGEGDEYRCFSLPTRLNKSIWVKAVDFQPGDNAAVHCTEFRIERAARSKKGDGSCGSGDLLGVWLPGQTPAALPEGVGQLVPAGANISLRIHYRKSSHPVKLQSSLGLYFAKGRSLRQPQDVTLVAADHDPTARTENVRVKASYTTPESVAAISIRPLLFPYAKSVEVTAYRPDGTTEVLIWAKNYKYDWQPEYVFNKPVSLPRNTRIEAVAYLDGSARLNSPLCELSFIKDTGVFAQKAISVSAVKSASHVANSEDEFYVCPMHPDVTADSPGKCPKCAMALMRTPRPEAAEYDLRMTTTPAVVKPGEKFRLTFSISHPKTGAPVKDFNIVHDMPFHLFIVSQDLTYFSHIHPEQQREGSFIIDTEVPKAGSYVVFCDLFPVGGLPQVVHRNLITDGFKGDLYASQARLEPDKNLTKTVGGIRFQLALKPGQPIGGKPATLNYLLTDEKTGEPVKDLQPYLAAWGHTLILSEDASEYIHSHPSVMIPDDADRQQVFGGPDVSFDAFFPRPGRYRIWSQFQRQGQLITVSFTINVKGL